MALELSLVVLLAFASADLLWTLFPAPGLTPKADVTPIADGVASPFGGHLRASVDRVALSDAKLLFGGEQGRGRSERGPDVAEPTRETALDLELKGVLAHREIDKQLALIARAGRPEAVYARGDVISGARIVQIEARRVILDHDGVIESLTLEVEKLERVGDVLAEGGVHNTGIRLTGDNQRVVARDEFQRQVAALGDLVKQAQAVPHLENGEPAGLRVTRIQAGSVFADLGLQQQDVIRSVNGSPVRTARDAMQAYEALKSANDYAIGVLRDGHEVTLNYSIR